MSLFKIPEQTNEHRERAKAMLLFANQVSEEIKRLYDMGREMMWNVPGYKVEDAQKILNELRLLAPPGIEGDKIRYGGDVELFRYHGGLGTFLSSIHVISPEEVASPVSYTLVGGSIVLTGDRYPTEPIEPPVDTTDGLPTDPAEPPVEPVEEPVESPAGPAEEPVESPAEPPVEPVEEPVESPAEPVEEPSVESPAEPPVEPVEEPSVESPAEPLVEPVEEPTEPPALV